MPMDLATARQAAQQRGERPPGGEQPGTPEYDRWVMDWFTAGVDAGDPDLVRRVGGGSGAGFGAGQAEEGTGGIAPWQDAAPSSEWLGRRVPTPRELRRFARDAGWSEDFQRYDDRQLAQWLRDGGWDVQRGGFAGGVEKPTETGGLMAPGARAGGGGGGQRGAPAALAGSRPVNPADTTQGLLNSPLAQLLANQGGFLRQFDANPGNNMPGVQGGVMKGGGIWYMGNQGGQSAAQALAARQAGIPSNQPDLTLQPYNPGGPRQLPLTPRSQPGSQLTNMLAPLQTGMT